MKFLDLNGLSQLVTFGNNSYVSSVIYDSTNHVINFKNANGSVISSIDASNFIKDGMVSNVTIDTPETGPNVGKSCLIVTFNTYSGKDPIEIPIENIFSSENYYTKTEIDDQLDDKQDTLISGTNIKTINNQSIVGSGNINITADGCEVVSNKVTSLSSSSTDTQYPSAKAVYDELSAKVSLSDYESDEEVVAESLNDLNARITSVESNKQDTISDIETIRSNAAAGAAKVSNVQSDWNAASGDAQILNKPNLATVATSGDYSDLSNKPTIGNGMLMIQQNGSDVESFSANQTGTVYANITVPTDETVSEWGFTKNTGTYSKPSGGIPKNDLASAVQTSLDKADTALQSYTETDPVFSASAAAGISSDDISNWNNKVSNVQADWNATSGDAVILNKPDIVTDKFSNFDYLNIGTGTNTIHTSINAHSSVEISDGKNSINLDRGGDNGISITANDGADGTIKLTASNNIYLDTSGTNKAYYNDKEIATKNDIPAAVTESTVAGWGFTKNTGTLTTETDPIYSASAAAGITSSDINNWNNKVSNVQSDWNATSGNAQILNKPNLATIATSGDYSDLLNKPTIDSTPTRNSTNLITSGGVADAIENRVVQVEELPEPSLDTCFKIYVVCADGSATTSNIGKEYVTVWDMIGYCYRWELLGDPDTVTQVKVGSTAYNPSDGVVSLPAYPTSLPASDVSSWAKASSKPTYTASEVGAIATSARGAANGVAPLNASSKIDATYLPSYVDDVLEYSGMSNFPSTGEAGKIYTDTSTNKIYRWSGSQYIEISPSAGVTVTNGTSALSWGTDVTVGTVNGVNITAKLPSNPDTWRGIQDNLTSSTNTTESLSAKQGYLLANGSARDNTKLPLTGGTLTGTLSISSNNDAKIILDNTDNETNYQQIAFLQNGTEYARLGTYGDTVLRWDVGGSTHKIWHEGNDGAGSGLDADTLDGYHASSFASSGHTHSYLPLSGGTMTGYIKYPQWTNSSTTAPEEQTIKPFDIMDSSISPSGSAYCSGLSVETNYVGFQLAHYGGDSTSFFFRACPDTNTYGDWYTLWHSGNDGSGSGLDADLLDGQHGSYYAAASSIPTKVSQLTNDSGYTTNTGTVTQVKIGSTAYNPSSGVISLPAYPTSLPASDVYSWAKASSKPSYSWSEITDKPSVAVQGGPNNFIHSSNEFTFVPSGHSGSVYFNYRTVGGTNGNITEYIFGNGKGGALGTAIHTGNFQSQALSKSQVTTALGYTPPTSDTNTTYAAGTGVTISGSNNAINVTYGSSANTACQGNDSRLSNARPASDVYAWAKASSKPSYDNSEIGLTTITATGGSSLTLTGGKIYRLINLTGSFQFILDVTDVRCEDNVCVSKQYHCIFSTGSTAPTINWPAIDTWYGGSAPVIEANKTYEFDIIYNATDVIAICVEVA